MGVQVPSEPITRKEQYLAKAAGQAVEIPAEPITREEAYLDAIAKGSGGGGGTSNYNQLENKPQINGNTLTGNKTASQLGLASASDVKKEFGGTLEQWNALSTEQKKEYDTYDITNDYSDGNYIYLPTIYSEEEREVGVWTDGKPLYQRTITKDLTLSLSWQNYYDLTGIDLVNVEINKLMRDNESIPLVFSNIGVGSWIKRDGYLKFSVQGSQASEGWVLKSATIQYTKTTDTAGSGTWTPTGQYAHHYSTDEQIVGTWIDGSTLYERTITGFSLTLQSGVAKDTEVDISYVSKLISVDALGDDDISVLPVAGYKINNTLQMLGFMNGNVINKAVIQYTKTA